MDLRIYRLVIIKCPLVLTMNFVFLVAFRRLYIYTLLLRSEFYDFFHRIMCANILSISLFPKPLLLSLSRSLSCLSAVTIKSKKKKSKVLVRKFELYPTFTKCSTVFSGSNCLTEVSSIPPQLQLRLKVFYEINSNVLSYFQLFM